MRLTARLLDADERLLGWADFEGRFPGDGTIVAAAPVVVPIERDGVVASCSVHWPDANIEVRVPWDGVVRAGVCATLAWPRGVVMHLGMPPRDVPCVTVRQPVVVAPAAGGVGASG